MLKKRLITLDVAATALFTAVVVPAVFIDATWSDATTIAVCMTLFAVGMFGFLASFPTAFERSRRDEIGAANLYLLTGNVTPKDVKRRMLGALAVQVIVAVTVACIGVARQENAQRLNPMAFAVLVPMLGFGLNGLWAARYGTFGPRILAPKRTGRSVVDTVGSSDVAPMPGEPDSNPESNPDSNPDSDVEMEQNSSHG